MTPVLLVDFGSTNTKITAVDVDNAKLLGTACAFTTVDTDINDGLSEALCVLEQTTGRLEFARRFACSSAAGGLRMATSGLVPSLTAEAARLACLGAGAKLVGVYAYELTDEDVLEIARLAPDIFLLTGGVDGGNKEAIIHNAEMLASCAAEFPVLLAGNRAAAAQCEKLLAGREVIRCPNVMPKLDKLYIEPVQQQIRELFLARIIQAKGLSKANELVCGILMPTPSAMLKAMQLLADGASAQPGIGELMAVDLGGATTDVYSIARGTPENDSTILKGLPEPYAKRTVEGDIGMRYSAGGVLQAAGAQRLAELSGLDPGEVEARVDFVEERPGVLPDTPAQKAFDYALASAAVETAAARHAGVAELVYTPTGPVFAQSGKDLTGVKNLIVTGGAIVCAGRAEEIAAHARFDAANPESLRPKKPRVLVDRRYILAAMGLLAEQYPEVALTIMKKELYASGPLASS